MYFMCFVIRASLQKRACSQWISPLKWSLIYFYSLYLYWYLSICIVETFYIYTTNTTYTVHSHIQHEICVVR